MTNVLTCCLMAKLFSNLGFDAHGYDYGRSLMILDDTLAAAERGLEHKREGLVADLADYEASGSRIGERADDGSKIWDQSDAYASEIELVDEGLANFRKSYVIAFYHSWERMVGRWANVGAKADHKELRQAVQDKGGKPHPRLDAVRDLNNALKHNSEVYGAALLKSWPEVLPPDFGLPDNYSKSDSAKINWFSLIAISGEQMREIIDALRASGPEPFPRNMVTDV